MSWFYILFGIVLGIFIIKTLISTVFGDMDIDFDVDGDIDFDVSSMLSFKGILHFLLGFSSYLSIFGYVNHVTHFSFIHYIIAFIVGIIFMIGLYYLYKLVIKLNHHNEDNPNFDGCNATVLTSYNNGWYDVLIMTYQGTLKRKLQQYDNYSTFKIGDECTIRRVNGQYFLTNISDFKETN